MYAYLFITGAVIASILLIHKNKSCKNYPFWPIDMEIFSITSFQLHNIFIQLLHCSKDVGCHPSKYKNHLKEQL